MRLWGLIAAIVPACVHSAAPSPPKPAVVAKPAASPSASSSVAPKEIEVRFEQRPIDEKTSAIWLAIPGFERQLFELPASHACVVEPRQLHIKSAPDHPVLVCGNEERELRLDGTALRVTGTSGLALPAVPRLHFGHVSRVGAANCPAGALGPRLRVTPRVFFVEDSRDPSVELEIPFFGVKEELGTGPFNLRTTRFKKAQKLVVSLQSVEHAWSVEVAPKDGRLVLTRDSQGMKSKRTVRTVGVFWLPCGATLELEKADYRDPRWVPLGAECLECHLQHAACAAPCLDDLTDEEGDLTAAGKACEAQCDQKAKACEDKCRAQYKY